MKKLIQESFALLITHRQLLTLSIALVVLSLAFALYVALSVQPSELQLVSHCSAFGVTHLYRDQWFYLFSFGVFGLLAAALHVFLSAKILMIKGPSLAALFLWAGIAVVILAWASAYPVINIFNVGDCRNLIGQ